MALLLALVAGFGGIWWQTRRSVDAARGAARREAMARTAALEGQFTQVRGAVETLAALARQGGGTIPNFQRIGTDLLAAWPGVAWLELEPGGVVSDLVPRAGHERALGVNVLKDPAQQAGALEASQKLAPTVSAPVAIGPGEWGLVLRAPIVLRGRDGREVCSGYVAAAMRLRDSVARLKPEELAARGYDSVFYLVNPFPPKETLTIAGRGRLAFPGPELQSMPFQNARFFLALQPRGGWVSKPKLVLECLAVVFISGVIWLALHLLETGRDMERSLAQINQRLTRASAERKQGQDALAAAQDELKLVRAALQKAESVAADFQARAEAAARGASDNREALQAKLKEAQSDAQGLQARLESAARSFKAKQVELEEVQEALQSAQTALTELETRTETELSAARKAGAAGEVKLADAQNRLEAATAAEREAGRNLEALKTRVDELEDRNHSLEARLLAAAGADPLAVSALQARLKEQEATIAELQARLETAVGSARDAAEDIAAAVARLDQLEDRNRKLKARLLEVEGLEARLAETTVSLEVARAELAGPPAPRRSPDLSSAPAVDPGVPPPPGPSISAAESAPEPSAPPPPSSVLASQPMVPIGVEPAVTSTAGAGPDGDEEAPADLRSESPFAPAAAIAELPTEELAKPKPVKPGRPKKARPDDLFDFFGTPMAAEPELASPNGALSFGPAFAEPATAASEDSEAAELPPADEVTGKPLRAPRGASPVNLSFLRKAIGQIMPLFVGEDPGAKDCLKDNRAIFRSAFAPEAYAEFEQTVKSGDFAAAAELLKKAARRHGIAV